MAVSDEPDINDEDLNEARAALEQLEAQLRELDQLSREEDAAGASTSEQVHVQSAPSSQPVTGAEPATGPAVQPAVQVPAKVQPPAEAQVAAPAATPEPSVFREVRTAEGSGTTKKKRSTWKPLLFLALLTAIGTGVWWSWNEGVINLNLSNLGIPVPDLDNGYEEQPISLEPLPETDPEPGSVAAAAAPGGAVDVDLEPDFIRFKQPVEVGPAVLFFQMWRLGKVEHDGASALGHEYILLDVRVRNASKKEFDPRQLFANMVMFDGDKNRLPNLVLERNALQRDLPATIAPEKSELLTFVYQADSGSGDYHLRLPGTPPRQLDLAANPAMPVGQLPQAPSGVSLFP